MTEDGVPSNAALKEASVAFTVLGKLLLTKSVTVTSTAAGVSGVVKVVASVVAQYLEHLVQFTLMLPNETPAQY